MASSSSSSNLPPGNLHLSQAMLSTLHQRRRDAISLGCLTSPPPLASPAISMPAMSPQAAMPWGYFMPQSMPATPAGADTFPLPEMTTPADTFAHDAFPWHASETPAWSADFAPPASTTVATSASVDASSLDYLQSLLLPAWTPTVTTGPSSSSAPVNAGQQIFAGFQSQLPAFDPLQAAVAAPTPALDDVKATRSPAKVLAYQGRVREQRAAVSSTVEALRSAYRGPQHQDPLGRRVRSILAGGADTEWRTEEWAGFGGSNSSSADTSSPSNSGSPAWPPTPSSSSSSSPSNNNASSSSNPHSPPTVARGHKRARSATSAISPPAVHFGGGQDLREYKVAIRRLQQNAHKHRLRNRDVQEMTILCDTVAFVLQQQQQQEREQSMSGHAGGSAFFAASPTSSPSPSQRLWDTLRHILLLHRSEWALLVAAERRLSQAMKLERQKQTIGSKRRKAVVAGGAGADVGHATDAAWLSWLAASGGSADGRTGMMAGMAGEGEASSVEYGSIVAGALKLISEVL